MLVDSTVKFCGAGSRATLPGMRLRETVRAGVASDSALVQVLSLTLPGLALPLWQHSISVVITAPL